MARPISETVDRKAKWAARAYRQGTPVTHIARDLHTTSRNVHRWLLRAGITPDRVKVKADA